MSDVTNAKSLPWYDRRSLLGRVWLKGKVASYRWFMNSDEQQFFTRKYQILSYAVRLGLYEKRFFTNLSHLIAPGSTVLDVGAHVGLYTERMAEIVGITGRVFCIEPYPVLASQLEARFSALHQVSVIQAALSDHEGMEQLSVPQIDGCYPEPALASLEESTGPTKLISTRTLDSASFFRNFKKLDFVKLDTEGHEKAIIQNASQEITELRPIIQLEMNSDDMKSFSIEKMFDLQEYKAVDQNLYTLNEEQDLPYMFYLVPKERELDFIK